jgi:hypothetical protein
MSRLPTPLRAATMLTIAVCVGSLLRFHYPCARRQLLLPVSDNYFCRRRVSKKSVAHHLATLGC